MRRIAIAMMSTISGLVLLFSYHTSTGQGSTAGTLGSGSGSGTGTGLAGTGGTGSGRTDPGSVSGAGSANGDPANGNPANGNPANGGSANDGSAGGGATGGSAGGATTVTGDAAQTRWGPVQVQITVRNGRIIASEAVVYPQANHRDVEINSYAVPVLNDQAVSAQSAQIDGVSGATVTSLGYQQSLQSAIDKARLG